MWKKIFHFPFAICHLSFVIAGKRDSRTGDKSQIANIKWKLEPITALRRADQIQCEVRQTSVCRSLAQTAQTQNRDKLKFVGHFKGVIHEPIGFTNPRRRDCNHHRE
jgi:hypothetical protein